jgi:hypothetical protein
MSPTHIEQMLAETSRAEAITHGNSTSAYDRSGRFSGSVIQNSDGSRSFYDARGKFSGSSTNTSQPK